MTKHSRHLCQFLTKEGIDDDIINQVKNRLIYYNTYYLFNINHNLNLKISSFYYF